MTYAQPIDIFNDALARLGEDTTDVGADDAAAVTFRTVFTGAARRMMARHKFSFARKTAILSFQGPSLTPEAFVYSMPPDLLLFHAARFNRNRFSFELEADKFLTFLEDEEIFAYYTHYADVDLWSAGFAEAVVFKMQAIISKAILLDQVAARELDFKAEDLLLDELAIDRAQYPPSQWVASAPLVDTWQNRQYRLPRTPVSNVR